jgi:hypothetical protein
MAQEGIYRNPIFLNSVQHKSVHIAPVDNYLFGRKLNSVLIVGQEFLEAAKHFPVVFAKSGDDISSLAILGLRNNQNLFVNKEGEWRDDTYVPAFFRRYPFILADDIDSKGSSAVCVDSGYAGFGRKDGMKLFKDDGSVSDEFDKVISFLKNFQVQHESTKKMISTLNEYELFRDISANITLPDGEKLGFAGLMMVDEMAMLSLDDEKALNLFRKGYLAWIHAHLYSLSNFRKLLKVAADV